MAERLADPALILAAIEQHNEASRALLPDPDAGARRRKELGRRRARIIETFFDGLISRDARDAELRVVDAQLQAISSSRPAKVERMSERDVARMLLRWPRLEWRARREMLEALAPTFQVHRYEIRGVSLPEAGLFSKKSVRIRSARSRERNWSSHPTTLPR